MSPSGPASASGRGSGRSVLVFEKFSVPMMQTTLLVQYRGVQAPGGSGKKPSVEAVQLKKYFEKKKSGSQSFRAQRVLNDYEGF